MSSPLSRPGRAAPSPDTEATCRNVRVMAGSAVEIPVPGQLAMSATMSAMNRLEGEITVLADTLGELGARLEPITNNSPHSSKGDPENSKDCTASPLVNRIRAETQRVADLAHRVQEQMQRLEL